jgi:hypothetical protein
MRHPIQPIEKDARGVLRFKSNKIVEHLLEHGGIDLNKLAVMDFSREDREQFAQLIGYSLSGFGSLSYVSDETYAAAEAMSKSKKLDVQQARIGALEAQLDQARQGVRDAAVALFRIHPDDLDT